MMYRASGTDTRRLVAVFVAICLLGGASALAEGWDREWITTYSEARGDAAAVAIDSHGDVIAGGRIYTSDMGSDAYFLVKLNGAGEILWTTVNDVSASNDRIEAIALDPDDNIYVTGFANWYGGEQFVTAKVSADGTVAWTAIEENPYEGQSFRGIDVGVDAEGNPTTVGFRRNDSTTDLYIAHYDTDGVFQWDDVYDGGGTLYEELDSVAVLPSGTIYAAGKARIDELNQAVTVKYTSEGDRVWMKGYIGDGYKSASAHDVAVTTGEVVYVAGQAIDAVEDNTDLMWVLYAADGERLSAGSYDLANRENPYGFAVDDAGIAYLVGNTTYPAEGYDWLTVSFAGDSSLRWAETWNSGLNSRHIPIDAAVRPDGAYAFSTGYHWESGTGSVPSDVTTVAYDRYGNRVWTDLFGSTATLDAEGRAIAATDDGRTVVAGFSPDEAADFYSVLTVAQYRTCTGCLIDGACVPEGARRPENACETCDADVDPYAWTPQADGASCADAFFCYTEATCQATVCTPTVYNCNDGIGCTADTCDEDADRCVNAPDDSACDDGNVCTDDVCDPSQNGCVTTFNNDPCDDGLFCTGDDSCSNGTCSHHAGTPCDDDQTCDEDADICVDDPGLCGFAGTGGAESLAVFLVIAAGLIGLRRRRGVAN